MAKTALNYYAPGTQAHAEIENLKKFRESGGAGALEIAIERAQSALGVVDTIMGREKLSDGGVVKELIKSLAAVKIKTLGSGTVAKVATESTRSTRPKLAYLSEDRT